LSLAVRMTDRVPAGGSLRHWTCVILVLAVVSALVSILNRLESQPTVVSRSFGSAAVASALVREISETPVITGVNLHGGTGGSEHAAGVGVVGGGCVGFCGVVCSGALVGGVCVGFCGGGALAVAFAFSIAALISSMVALSLVSSSTFVGPANTMKS